MRAGLYALLLAASCSNAGAPARTAAPARPPLPQNPAAPCVDRYLAAHGLNPFGDPPDTAYAGGSPLLDERSGTLRDRTASVLSRHPEIARACALPDAGVAQDPR